MNRFNFDPNLTSGSPCFQEFQNSSILPTVASSPHLSRLGYSVRSFNPPHSGHLNQQATCQDIHSPSRELNVFFISQCLPTVNNLVFPEFYSQKDLDAIVPCSVSCQPANDNISYTIPTSTNPQQFEQLPSGFSSITFSSQPSSQPATTFHPLNKDTLQQAPIDTAATVSTNCGNVVQSLKRTFCEVDSEVDIADQAKTTAAEKTDDQKAYLKAYKDKLQELVSLDTFIQAKAAGKAARKKAYRNTYQNAYQSAYHAKMSKLVSSDIFEQAKTAGRVAGRLAVRVARKKTYRKGYQTAYHKAHNDKLKELVSSDIFEKARTAGQAAGKAAVRATEKKVYGKAYNDELKALVSSDIFEQAKAAGQAASYRIMGIKAPFDKVPSFS